MPFFFAWRFRMNLVRASFLYSLALVSVWKASRAISRQQTKEI